MLTIADLDGPERRFAEDLVRVLLAEEPTGEEPLMAVLEYALKALVTNNIRLVLVPDEEVTWTSDNQSSVDVSDGRLQMNNAMARLKPNLPLDAAAGLAPKLAELLDEGFEERGGMVLLQRYANSADRVVGREDATGVEAFLNHVHVEDELPGVAPGEVLAQTWRLAAALASALADGYPGDEFVVIVVVSDSCIVRFHKLRPGQRWLAEDIEGYQEAVLSLTVGGRS